MAGVAPSNILGCPGPLYRGGCQGANPPEADAFLVLKSSWSQKHVSIKDDENADFNNMQHENKPYPIFLSSFSPSLKHLGTVAPSTPSPRLRPWLMVRLFIKRKFASTPCRPRKKGVSNFRSYCVYGMPITKQLMCTFKKSQCFQMLIYP